MSSLGLERGLFMVIKKLINFLKNSNFNDIMYLYKAILSFQSRKIFVPGESFSIPIIKVQGFRVSESTNIGL